MSYFDFYNVFGATPRTILSHLNVAFYVTSVENENEYKQ